MRNHRRFISCARRGDDRRDGDEHDRDEPDQFSGSVHVLGLLKFDGLQPTMQHAIRILTKVWRFPWGLVWWLMVIAQPQAVAQERQWTLTLTQPEMDYLGSLIDVEKSKPSGQLVQQLANKIQVQISQQVQTAQAEAVEVIRRQGREQAEADAKAKAAKESPP
jgi:hypothetical protein